MKILSIAFTEGKIIPDKYTCKGENINPELLFENVPSQAKSLGLIMHDPDAPREGGFTHWVVYNMPPQTKAIPVNSTPPGIQSKNDAGENQYMGPCPHSGTHRYFFKLYALDTLLSTSIQSKNDLEKAMTGHIVDQAELMGTFAQ